MSRISIFILVVFLLTYVHCKSVSSHEYDVLKHDNVELRRELAENRKEIAGLKRADEETRTALNRMVSNYLSVIDLFRSGTIIDNGRSLSI